MSKHRSLVFTLQDMIFLSLVLLLCSQLFADGRESVTIEQMTLARSLYGSEEYENAWKIWDIIASDDTNPIRHHAMHLAVIARMELLINGPVNLSEKAKADLKVKIERDLLKLGGIRSYPLKDETMSAYLQFLADHSRWNDIVTFSKGSGSSYSDDLTVIQAMIETDNLQGLEKKLKRLHIKMAGTSQEEQVQKLCSRLSIEIGRDFPVLTVKERFDRAKRLDRKGARKRALEEFEALGLQSQSEVEKANARIYRARILYDTRQNQEALDAYDEFIKLHHDHSSVATAYFRKGIIYKRLKDYDSYLKTVRNLEISHKGSKWWSVALMGRGDYYRSKGQYELAARDFIRVINGSTDHRDTARWKLAWVAFNQKDYATAVNRMKRMRKHYSGTGWELPVKFWLARFRDLNAGKEQSSQTEALSQIASDHCWTFYGSSAMEAIGSESCYEGHSTSLSEYSMTSVETGNKSVQAALMLQELGYYERAVAEWKYAARKIRKESEGFILRYADCLSRYEDIPAARRLLINYYQEAVDKGDLPEFALRMLYPVPESLKQFYLEAAQQNDLDPRFALAVTLQESGFDQRALSHNLAGGLMQVMPELFNRFSRHWKPVPAGSDYQIPELNIRAGTEYLAWLLEEFNGSRPKALAGYNAGEHRVTQWQDEYKYEDMVWIEHIPFQQTRMFVKHVLENYKAYQRLYDVNLNHSND